MGNVKALAGFAPIAVAAIILGASIGCGGAGSATSFTGGGSGAYSTGTTNGGGPFNANNPNVGKDGKPADTTGLVSVFFTDAAQGKVKPEDAITRFAVRVYEIDVTGPKDSMTVFKDSGGRLIDLKALSNLEKPGFAFFGAAPQTITQALRIQILLDKNVSVEVGGKSKQLQIVDSQNFEKKYARVLVNLKPQPAIQSLVIGFNTDKLETDKGGRLSVKGGEGDSAGLEDPARQIAVPIEGTIAGIGGVAPAQTFGLALADKTTLHSAKSADTLIFDPTGKKVDVLAEAVQARAMGRFVMTSQTFVVDTVRVLDKKSAAANPASAEGTASAYDAENKVLSVQPVMLNGFAAEGAVKVAFNDKTEVATVTGEKVEDVAKAIGEKGIEVEVRGAYDEKTKKFTASQVILGKAVNAALTKDTKTASAPTTDKAKQ